MCVTYHFHIVLNHSNLKQYIAHCVFQFLLLLQILGDQSKFLLSVSVCVRECVLTYRFHIIFNKFKAYNITFTFFLFFVADSRRSVKAFALRGAHDCIGPFKSAPSSAYRPFRARYTLCVSRLCARRVRVEVNVICVCVCECVCVSVCVCVVVFVCVCVCCVFVCVCT